MFAAIGRIADRYRFALLIGWIAAAVIVTLVAPNLNDVTSNKQSDFLPKNASSVVAEKVVAQYFPQEAQNGSIVLVFDAGQGQKIADPSRMAFVDEISRWLVGPEKPAHVLSVVSPTLNPEAAANLVSADGQIAMVVVNINTTDEKERAPLLDTIGTHLKTAPAGLKAYRSGEVALGSEYNSTLTKSVDRTIFVTLILVVLILLAIYRSPVSPAIPLFVVTIAFIIARGIVAFLGKYVFTVSDIAVMMLIVIMYGAGTDYCLFLISRFREEMADRDESRESVRRTVRYVGESISSSAGTVITGFAAMAMAKLGLFNTTGPTLAVGVIVSLIAGLTLTPAILGLLGRRTFWPSRAQHRSTGALYKRTSQWVSSRPRLIILVIVTVMAPLAYYGSRIKVTYDFLADLPKTTESVAGFRVLEDHIGAGEMQPLTAVAVLNQGNPLAQVEQITHTLEQVPGVAAVRSATQPLGGKEPATAGITRLDHQLGLLASILQPGASAGAASGAGSQPSPEQQRLMQNLLADLPAYLALAAERAPELAQNPAYNGALSVLDTLSKGGDGLPALAASLGALAQSAPDVYLLPGDLPSGVAAVFGGQPLAGLVGSYLNLDSQAARFEIVLNDTPYSMAALDTVDRLKTALSQNAKSSALHGSSVVAANIRDALRTDQRLTIGLVLLGIFVILLIMLRSVVAPLYLIGTILLSYRTTLGITRIASSLLWGTDRLTWWVPFFMFVFLVALGIDYSIFLFGRIKEDVRRQGIHEGIHHAVQSTGSIITSAGIIVAGTFSAMLAGDILGLAQIGFAVSVGILIDTFVVRTVLDPALATFFGRWTWWPGNVARVEPSPETPGERKPSTPLTQPGGLDR